MYIYIYIHTYVAQAPFPAIEIVRWCRPGK